MKRSEVSVVSGTQFSSSCQKNYKTLERAKPCGMMQICTPSKSGKTKHHVIAVGRDMYSYLEALPTSKKLLLAVSVVDSRRLQLNLYMEINAR